MKKFFIGVDIGGTRTKLGLVDLSNGEVLEMAVFPTETKSATVFENVIGNHIAALQGQDRQIIGVGVGVSGFVFGDGTVDSTYGFMDFMEDYPLARIIEEKHGIPCRVDNDARLVALGEAVYGQGRGHRRVLTLTLGTGLGVGMVIDQKLNELLPYAHMAGHMSITENNVKCYCGKPGCLESLVSATGVVNLARRKHWNSPFSDVPITSEHIFQDAEQGNLIAQSVIREVIGYLRTGIDNFVNIYTPDVVILGGGMATGLKNNRTELSSQHLLRCFRRYETKIEISELGEKAGILGAALLFMK